MDDLQCDFAIKWGRLVFAKKEKYCYPKVHLACINRKKEAYVFPHQTIPLFGNLNREKLRGSDYSFPIPWTFHKATSSSLY